MTSRGEHLLLGLLGRPEEQAARAPASLEVTAGAVRAEVAACEPSSSAMASPFPPTPPEAAPPPPHDCPHSQRTRVRNPLDESFQASVCSPCLPLWEGNSSGPVGALSFWEGEPGYRSSLLGEAPLNFL